MESRGLPALLAFQTPIFYSAAAQPRAPPDGPCLQASPGPRRPTRPLEWWGCALHLSPSHIITRRCIQTGPHTHAAHTPLQGIRRAVHIGHVTLCFYSYEWLFIYRCSFIHLLTGEWEERVFFVTTLKTWNNRRTAEVGFYLQTSRFCHEYMEVVRGLGEVVC